MKGISDQDCEYAQQVWNTMEKKTLACYHDTYLKKDVLLLADISIWKQMFYYWQMHLRPFRIHV